MSRNGLTFTVIFLAESANYGEGVGNISTLKKMTRGNYEQYSYISRQALRYNMIQQLGWDTTPVDGKSGVVQFAPSASIRFNRYIVECKFQFVSYFVTLFGI